MKAVAYINGMLGNVRQKLESLDPKNRVEEGATNSQHSGPKMSAARKRLAYLYGKLTTGRSEANQVKATGTKRK